MDGYAGRRRKRNGVRAARGFFLEDLLNPTSELVERNLDYRCIELFSERLTCCWSIRHEDRLKRVVEGIIQATKYFRQVLVELTITPEDRHMHCCGCEFTCQPVALIS